MAEGQGSRVRALMVASLEPLTRRRQGSCTCAGSQATAVIHLLCPAQSSQRRNHLLITLPRKPLMPAAALSGKRQGPQQAQLRSNKHGLASSAARPSCITEAGDHPAAPLQQPSGLPVWGSHSQSAPSMPPVASICASGDQATHSTQFLCPCARHAPYPPIAHACPEM